MSTRTGVLLLAAAAVLTVVLALQLRAPTVSPTARPATFHDGEILGKVVDREGNAQVRARNRERWDVAGEARSLLPGDWVQTGSCGANAIALQMSGGARLILGPAGLLEIVDAETIKLLRGELEVEAPDGGELRVESPAGKPVLVRGTRVVRVRDSRSRSDLEVLKEEPAWLKGYKSNESTEAMGSLLANVDGRNVPLTMGYHKVTVDIRDQIARTVVEESFVNHTHHVLEGVFYFPLPGDASISGFAMWIGDEKVEGEIVEKQRAREIYETILAEKRDPGLLEWTGGNLFKARVYPIGAEKRIQITYTQVLPKVGDTYSYHYALRSELTRLTPLERLEVVVEVSSAQALSSVTCPTHPCRIDTTSHAARIEFSAEDTTPQRDFEVRIQTPPDGNRVTMVPHRRGDEGYFLLLVDAPPADEVAGDSTSRDASPFDCVLIVDTSGSMAGPQRETQLALLEAFLGGLGPRDRFQVLTVDTETRAAFDAPVVNDPAHREKALSFVQARRPLGWTDLESAFREAFEQARDGTHVVYIGDGVVTRGDTDPAAFLSRAERLGRKRGTVHTVALGSSYETLVMAGLAHIGGGTTRAIGDAGDPALVAHRLLRDITTPRVRDLEASFSGIDVAAVYPDRISNLAAGTQAVIVGRFDPAFGDASGEVHIRGRFGGNDLSYRVPVSLEDADRGNSFIPRLWARRRLDHLLRQGRSPGIREGIIALSEDYQIITPYTSFLVLESEEDRERFQVRKRFRMRDGEEFFAEGRDRAEFELTREQMRLARLWRLRLREEVLRGVQGMSRDATEELRTLDDGSVVWHGDAFGLAVAGSISDRNGRFHDGFSRSLSSRNGELEVDFDGLDVGADEIARLPARDESEEEILSEDLAALEATFAESEQVPASSPVVDYRFDAKERGLFDAQMAGGRGRYAAKRANLGRLEAYGPPFYSTDPLESLFPHIPPVQTPPDSDWPEEIRDLVRTLNRRPWVSALEGGVAIEVTSRLRDSRHRTIGDASAEYLLGADSWWTTAQHLSGDEVRHDWLLDEERGALTESWLLGRVRRKQSMDEQAWSAPFSSYFQDLDRSYSAYGSSAETLADGRVRLTLGYDRNPDYRLELLIEPERALLLETRSYQGEKLTSITSYDAFVRVSGTWLPQEIMTRDAEGSITGEIRVAIEELSRKELVRRIGSRLESRDGAILRGAEPASLVDAKQAIADGKGDFEDHWMLLRELAARQMWNTAAPHVEAIADLTAGKRGRDRIRLAVRLASRRNESAKKLMLGMSTSLAAAPRPADRQCATELYQLASVFHGNERLVLVEALRPVHERQERLEPLRAYHQQVWECQQAMGWESRALESQQRLAELYPFDVSLHAQYASALAARGDVDEAMAHLTRAEEDHAPWRDHEIQAFRQTGINILFNAWRLEEAVRVLTAWSGEHPEQISSYHYNQYLSALIMLDRVEEAESSMREWLRASREPEVDTVAQARRDAAIQQALGSGWNMWRNRFDERWAEPLAAVARQYVDDPTQFHVAGSIVQHRGFGRTDPGVALRKELYGRLQREAATLPVDRFAAITQWLRSAGFHTDAGEDGWQDLFRAFLTHWIGTGEDDSRLQVQQVITGYGETGLQLRYWRHRIAIAGNAPGRSQAREALFVLLLAEPWSEAVEEELLALVPELGSPVALADDALHEANLDAEIYGFYRLASWLPRARAEAEVTALPEVNLMPRRELKRAREQALVEARAETAALLAELETEFEPVELRPWIRLERIYLQARGGVDPQALARETRELLDSIGSSGTPAAPRTRDRVFAERAVATLAHLALFSNGGEPIGAELLQFLDRRIDAQEDPIDARGWKIRLLIAADRAEEVRDVLEEWYGSGDEYRQVRWGRTYAYVLAELGDVAAAVEILLAIEKLDELTGEDYRTLAGWHKVQGSREKERAARIRAYEVKNEWELSNWLREEYSRYSRTGDDVPAELDPEVPLVFVALFQKAQDPQTHVWLLRDFYRVTRDFRLLECVPEAVLGQTAQRTYPFLEQMTAVTDVMQDEATLDRMADRAAALRERSANDVDRRALWMLEFLVRHRALEQRVGTEEHVRAVIHALHEAESGEWSDGEPLLMAQLLGSLRRLSPDAVGDEVIRQLADLQKREPRGSVARFRIAFHRAASMWNHERREKAAEVTGSAIRELRSKHGGRLPSEVHGELATHVMYLRGLGRYLEGEAILLGEQELPYNTKERLWIVEQLFTHYGSAVLSDAEVSLGRGVELYLAVEALYDGALSRRTNESHATNLVRLRASLWNDAHFTRHYPEVKSELVEFASTDLPRVMDLYQYRSGQQMVQIVAEPLRRIAGPLEGLRFLLSRAENEPRWLSLRGEDFWARHAHLLGQCFHEAESLDRELESRLLAVVLEELRQDLRTETSRSRYLYHDNHAYFWGAQSHRFAEVAQQVIGENRRSEGVIRHAAAYLYDGLDRADLAIAAVLDANERLGLSLEGRLQLSRYLQWQNRWAESVPILVSMIEDDRNEIEYRTMLMRGYFYTGADRNLKRTVEAAVDHSQREGRWQEDVIAALGAVCVETELFERAVGYYQEAIALHVKTATNRGVGDGVLAPYYRGLAGAFSGLGRTAEAVDAAAGAIVAWGPSQYERARALERLEEVLRDARDLDDYVEKLDADVERTGLENPIVRRALGKAYLSLSRPRDATKQLQAAVNARPDDLETRRLLVAAYDRAGMPEQAVEELLAAAEVAPREIGIFRELGDRWRSARREAESERAFTSIVEAMPNESEGHELLAGVREQQGRLRDASHHWREVAKIRSQEPTGYLELARVLITLGDWDEARSTVDTLRAREWPERFGDLTERIRELERSVAMGAN